MPMIQQRAWNQTVCIEERVTFHAEAVEFTYQQNQILCSLDGEFLKEGKQFNPPLPYSMMNIQVSTDNLEQILQPIYQSLLMDRDSLQE